MGKDINSAYAKSYQEHLNSIQASETKNSETKNSDNTKDAKNLKQQQSIFEYKDLNGNGKVDRMDFKWNKTLINIVKNNGWFGKKWDEVGEALNLLLRHVSPKRKETRNIEQALEQIVNNVDPYNYPESLAALSGILNEHVNIENTEDFIAKLFDIESSVIDISRSNIKIKLKDGTIITQERKELKNNPKCRWYVGYVVKQPNGEVLRYDSEGMINKDK